MLNMEILSDVDSIFEPQQEKGSSSGKHIELSVEELITFVSEALVDDYGVESSDDKACSIFILLRGVVGGGISTE